MNRNIEKQKTVFILGAGASYAGGAPLMGNFLDIASFLLRTNQVQNEEIHFRKVFDARSNLQAVFSKSNLDLNNVEDIFAAFEMGELLEYLPGYDSIDQIRDLIYSLVVVIVKTIGITHEYGLASEFQGPAGTRVFSPPKPYGKFAKLIRKLREDTVPKHDVSIITFNYDIGCDFALYWSHQNYSYHLVEEDKADDVSLLKLHGSLNWGQNSNNDIVVCKFKDFFSKFELEKHASVEDSIWVFDIGMRLKGCQKFKDINNNVLPFIVPPTWSKTSKYSAIRGVWRKAAKVIREADNIFISGYSFPPSDAFFKYLYAIGSISEKFVSQICVFDVEAPEGALEKRYRALLGPSAESKFTYHPISFEEAINQIESYFLGKKTAWGLRENTKHYNSR